MGYYYYLYGMGVLQTTKIVTTAEGKVERSETISYKKTGKEDDFVKTYINELALLRGIQAKEKDVLNELLKRMGYDNRVVLSMGVKEEICRDLNIMRRHKVDKETGEVDFSNIDDDGNLKPSTNALNVMVTRLCVAEVIKKVGKGIYEVNPHIFGKGPWENVKRIRKTTIWTKGEEKEETAIDRIVNKRSGNDSTL